MFPEHSHFVTTLKGSQNFLQAPSFAKRKCSRSVDMGAIRNPLAMFPRGSIKGLYYDQLEAFREHLLGVIAP